jgi:hypothetical protein
MLCLAIPLSAPCWQPRTANQEVRTLADEIDPAFADDEFWDDGMAEVARYKASRTIYGEPRQHEAVLITVKEDFNTEYYTKADWPYGQKPILPVLKQNQIAVVPTPNYSYHFMNSIFVDRTRFSRTVKASMTCTEWCGITTKEFQLWRDAPVQLFSSYWDGEGSGSRRVDVAEDVYLEEELPLVLRGLRFRDGLVARLRLVSNQTSNRAAEPTMTAAVLVVAEEESAWRVAVEAQDGRRIEYRFGIAYPRHLLSFDHSDGRSMELTSVTRSAYWELTQ